MPKETAEGEQRVALVPDVVSKLKARKLDVLVEAGAGAHAMLGDDAFVAAGAEIGDAAAAWGSDVVVVIAPPTADQIERLGKSSVLIGFLAPLSSPRPRAPFRPPARQHSRWS